MKQLEVLLLCIFLVLSPSFAQVQIGQDIDGEAAYDEFGKSVSLSSDGKRIAIGGYFNDATEFQAGHIRIFEETGGVWTQIGSDIDGLRKQDWFGRSVSLSSNGKRVAVGAPGGGPGNTIGNGDGEGQVRIFEEIGGVWTLVGNEINGEALDDLFGYKLSLSSDGKRVAIGAFYNDGNGNAAGHARIYEEIGGVWTQIGSDIDGEAPEDFSGRALSLSSDGKRVAIGAYNNDGNGIDAGHVRVYEEIGGIWSQIGNDIDGEAEDDGFGVRLSLSSDGKRVAIGAAWNDGNGNNSGHTRVYGEVGGTWSQIGNDIDGEAAGDRFGRSVSLSSDGKLLAIGAPGNAQNGWWSGHVRIYQEILGNWIQLGNDIDGEEEYDESGDAVSFSSDGMRVAIGAYNNDGINGNGSGHVRVFSIAQLTGIEEIKFQEIRAFPNPTADYLQFDLPLSSADQTSIKLFNASGLLVLSSVLSDNVLPLPNLPSGFYSFHISQDDKYYKGKVVLQ